MEKITNEKIYKIILAILITTSFLIVAIFCIFCIGLSRVEAKSYYWNDVTSLSLTSALYPLYNDVKSCGQTNVCDYGSTIWGANYVSNIYNVSINNGNSDNFVTPGSYSIEYRALIKVVGGNGSTSFLKKFFYFYSPDVEYQTATCDFNEQLSVVPTGNTNEFLVDWSCERFDVTRSDISYLALGYGYTDQLIYRVDVETNLRLIGEGENPNFDIIQNQDKNAQDIINNQNQNKNDIINNNNSNTDKVVDAIEGGGLENTSPINPNKKNELEEIEEGLLDKNITTSLNDIDISIDTNSNEFIWNLVTRIINTNSLIFGLVLTMLSLGVLKLVLNR